MEERWKQQPNAAAAVLMCIRRVSRYVLPRQGEPDYKHRSGEFCTFSRDLRSLLGWFKRQQVTEVVTEATGQYWRPVWKLLDGEVPRGLLVNPTHVKALAGRKTDRIDSQRLARYLGSRELVGSFCANAGDSPTAGSDAFERAFVRGSERVKNRITQMCGAGNLVVEQRSVALCHLKDEHVKECLKFVSASVRRCL
jgi:hypothetical protein